MRVSRLSLPAALVFACASQPLLAQTSITAGQTINGRLESSDPSLADDSHYDDYVISGQAGEQIVITLRSAAFDTYLQWGEGRGDNFEAEETDDDGGGGTDSQLTVTFARAGTWTIRANSLSGGETGSYTLEVRRSASGGGGGTIPTGGTPPSINAGQTIAGSLDSSDPLMEDDSHYDDYIYNGQPGDALVITLRSSDFDTYLKWGTGIGSAFQEAESDDDGAGGTDSQLQVTVSGSGPHVIRVNSLFEEETGSYSLSVTRAGGGGATAAGGSGGSVEANQSVRGRLESSDDALSDGSHFDTYTYQGRAGEEILITLISDDFDAYLRGGQPGAGGSFELIDSNDDGAGGTNSRLQARVPDSGVYVIQANSYAGGEIGEYTLSIQPAVGATAASAAVVRAGQPVSGQISSSDPRLSDNSHYDLFQYQGEPGQQIVVTMRSDDFDAYLAGGRLVGDELEVESSDDDGAGGTDARLSATVGPTGVFGIRANTLAAGETGSYSLTVEAAGSQPAPTPAAAGVATVAVGQTIRGTLGSDDRTLSDDSFFDQYVIQGRPGEQIEVTLASADFDSYLYWGRLNGDNFVTQSTDDDSAGGRDAQMLVSIGSDGTYAVRANSFDAGATGSYTLTVTPSSTTVAEESRAGSVGKWLFAYDAAAPALRPAAQRMKESQAFENLVSGLNARFTLPRPLTIAGEECGFENAFYSPSDEAITFCYELYEMLGDVFASDGQWTVEQREAVDGAVNFILMHEVGHAFVDLYDLPITGREEDAVDQLATMVLVDGGDKGAMAALNGVMALQPAENEFDQTDFADEHSLGPVRMFNVMCWIFGSNPDKYGGLVENGMLPEDRAVRCPSEYEQLSKSWQRLLQGNTNYIR